MIPTLNLLAPAVKQQLRRQRFLLLVHEVLLLLFIAVTLGSAILFGARLFLEQKFEEVALVEVPGLSKIARLNRNIKEVNQTLAVLGRITSDFPYWSHRIVDLTQLTPPGVRWNMLTVQANGKVTLKGIAEKRDDLVKFKEQLTGASSITNVDLPLHYLVATERIDFIVEISFNPEKVHTPL